MMGKATGNQTLADAKVFLYSAVSWWAAGTGLDYCTAYVGRHSKCSARQDVLVLDNRKLCAVWVHTSPNIL